MEESETRPQPVLFSNDDRIKESNLGIEVSQDFQLSTTSVDLFFEVDSTVSWIKENNYQRVALQFPDAFLHYASGVSRIIEDRSSAKTFILADTSYRSCCVDEIAAAHASCDSIVHYGDACLSSPSTNIPVRYVLGRLPFDVDQFVSTIRDQITEISTEEQIIFLTDAPYAYAIDDCLLKLSLAGRHPTIVAKVATLGTQLSENEEMVLGRVLPKSVASATESSTILFIGDEKSPLLPLFLLTYPHCSGILHYEPNQGATSFDRCLFFI
ncbi:unnamed protein product, partial [Mesorhabditis belari]|uniref:2-(3-amino-3-carboxypropyl)histidine synthase subunit 2 n=1 Tax=Mesorhabditis belari TaxID=2138241 RepID=A0AAF3J659_9BILA